MFQEVLSNVKICVNQLKLTLHSIFYFILIMLHLDAPIRPCIFVCLVSNECISSWLKNTFRALITFIAPFLRKPTVSDLEPIENMKRKSSLTICKNRPCVRRKKRCGWVMNCFHWRLNKVKLILKEIKELVMDKRAKQKAPFVSIYLSSALLVAGGMEAW